MIPIAAAILSATLLAGLWRVWRGPCGADRLIALMLLSTVSVAVLLLLGYEARNPFYLDVALTFAVLAALGAFVFTKRVWRQP